METLRSIMTSPVVGYLVMTLLHSLWQGAIVAGGLWVLLRTIKGKPNTRYALGILGLAVLIVAQFATYSTWEQRADRPASESPAGVRLAPAQDRGPANATLESPVASNGAKERSEPPAPVGGNHFQRLQWQHVVFLLWCVGAFLMSIRTGMWLADVQRLRRRCAVGIDSRLCERIYRLKELLAIARPVAIGFSNKVVVPCTVGLLRPMIVLPVNMAQMAGDEIESILLHELAHIKRLDWLVNILQMVLESLLFFNPAVWWISRQIRIEREAACDRYVVTRTRKPVHYAQLLLQFARTHHESSRAVAFASASDGSLTERVKRLIVPGYRATVHPGIIPVLLTLVTLSFCGIGAYKTTQATVRYFGRHMTPQQRADTVTALRKDYHTEGQPQPDLPKDQWIHVRGRVVTADGAPLPTREYTRRGRTYEYVDANLLCRTVNMSASHQIEDDGTFKMTVKQTRFTLAVTCEGYAAKHLQMECEPAESVDVVIELEKGYPAYVVCTDPQGHPVPNARITGGYLLPPAYSGYTYSIDHRGDPHGVVTIDNTSDALMTLTCQAPGFVKARKQKLRLGEGERLTWVLKPTPASHIHVTDARTGEPIEGAPVYLHGPEFYSGFETRASGETQTDATGHALLDSLKPDEPYLVMIRPAGMQRQYFTISAGQDIEAAFEPVQVIHGRVLGDLSLLSSDKDGPHISRTNRLEIGDSSHSSTCGNHRIPVTVVNDRQGTFKVEDYYGQQVILHAGPERVTLDIDAGDHLDEVLIHLASREATEGEGLRTVRFEFTGCSPKDIPPGATFRLLYREQGKTYADFHDIEIVDGQAQVTMPVTNSIRWEPQVGTPVFFKAANQRLDSNPDDTIEIPCMPGGSLYGALDVPEAYQHRNAYIRLQFENRDELLEQTGFLKNNDLNATTAPQTKFLFSPLPMGGKYRVTAMCQNMVIVSDIVHLTPEQPFCELGLSWPENTMTLRGKILEPEGHPATGVEYRITARSEGHSFSFNWAETDAGGSFECGPVNADPSISYRLQVKSNAWPSCEYLLKNPEQSTTLTLKEGLRWTGVLKDHDGNIRANAEFSVYPENRADTGSGYEVQTITTDAQGRFQATLADIEYRCYTRRLSRKNGRKSWSTDTVTFHPRRDRNLTIISDPH